jgi:hypothetical protein
MADEVVVPAEAAAEIVQEETPAEQTPVTEEVPAENTPEELPKPEPRKKTAQERIDELTKARREAEREREYWKNAALAKSEDRQPEPERPAINPALPPRPTLDRFDTTEAYEDALFEWRDTIREVTTSVNRAHEERAKAYQEFEKKGKKLREEHEDYDTVIENKVFSDVMQNVILQSDNGPEIAYFLGSAENRDVAEKIRSLPPARQAYEIGKLETNILLAKKTKKVPGAPPPIKPVGMGGTGGEKDPSEMSTAEWMAWDKKKTIEKIKQRVGG